MNPDAILKGARLYNTLDEEAVTVLDTDAGLLGTSMIRVKPEDGESYLIDPDDLDPGESLVRSPFMGRDPRQGDEVLVTLVGTVVDYDSTSEEIHVDIASTYHADPVDPDGIVVVSRLDARLAVPQLYPGQAYKKDGRVYLVYRDKPVGQGGQLRVLDSLTGSGVPHTTLIGAVKVLDIDPTTD